MSNVTINELPTANSIDGVNDLLPIFQNSSTSTLSINRNTLLGLGSAPVGLTDNQTITNKIINSSDIGSPVMSGTITGTYTIGGSVTFPSSVVTLTGSQTLTNKTINSPNINSPAITNATLSADTITGYSSSTSGTIYGISVSSSKMSGTSLSNGSITTTQIGSGAVLPAQLGLSSSYSGGVASYSNGGTAGGTFYYVNLGGLKLLWGQTSSLSFGAAATLVTASINFPNSFFSSVQTAVANVASASSSNYTWGAAGGFSASSMGVVIYNSDGAGGSLPVEIFVIGT